MIVAHVRDAEADTSLPGAIVTVVGDGEMMSATGRDGLTPPTLVPPNPTHVATTKPGYLERVVWLRRTGNQEGPKLRRWRTNQLELDVYPDAPRWLVARLVSEGNRNYIPDGSISIRQDTYADSVSVDASGLALLDDVPAGSLAVEGRSRGFASTAIQVLVPAEETLEVELALRDTLNTGVVEGRVTDAGTGRSLSAVTMRIEVLELQAATDGDGWFRFPKVPTGEYELTASADGYLDVSKRFRVIEGWTVTVDFSLSR